MGRMLEIRDAIGGGADYDYYPNGKLKQLKQLKDGGGTANSLIEYSVTGKPLRVVSPDGAETHYVYDFRDWLRDVVDPDGLLTRRVYQPDGGVQRIEKANDTSVHQIEARFWYNYDGSMQRLRPARGNQAPQSQTYDTTYWLDHFGRPDTIISFADGSVQSSPLYADGTVRYSRLRKQTPANNEWDYIYFEYDASKRMTKQRERHRGRTPEWRDTKEFSYDLAGRLLREFETGDDYTFDAGVDEEVIFDYDKLGRVKSETQNGRTVSYQYDKLGNRKQMTWPDGMSVDYDYDALNRLDSVRLGANTLVDYSYDLRGRMKTADFQNGTVTNFAFNNDNQMEGLGYVLKDEQGLAETLSWAHGYTPAGRLSQTNLLDNKHPSWAPSVAELISYAAPSLPGEAANVLDQYEQVSRNLVSKPYVYDDRGNLTSVGLTVSADYTNYQYNFENRLVSGTRGTTSFAYDYDVSGRRVGKIVDGLESRFLYAGDMEIAEYNDADQIIRRYVPGLGVDNRAAMITVSPATGVTLSRHYYHTDRLGSVIAVTDQAGQITDKYVYTPYGIEEPLALSGQPFRFTGRRFDRETGLYYYRARFYSQALGRFLETDPVGYVADMNLFTYTVNDPLNNTDPSGNIPLDTIADVAFIVYDVGALGYDGITTGGKNWKENTAALGADVTALFVPYGTGGGLMVRGASKVTVNAGRLNKLQNRTTKAANKLEGAFDGSPGKQSVQAAQRSMLAAQKRLKPDDMKGAIRDLSGNPVKRLEGGTFDHLDDVNAGLNGLAKAERQLSSVLNKSGRNLSLRQKTLIKGAISRSRKQREYIENQLEKAAK
jgi:RHS repeat-associated protein